MSEGEVRATRTTRVAEVTRRSRVHRSLVWRGMLAALALGVLIVIGGSALAAPGQQETPAYSGALSGVDTDFVPADGTMAPPDRRWVVVYASLNNVSGEPVVVAASDLTIVDQAGRRFAAQPSSPYTYPPLIGASLGPRQGVRGLVLFDLPRASTPEWLEWCPGGPVDCGSPVRIALTRTSSSR